jgi:hypothetical protein
MPKTAISPDGMISPLAAKRKPKNVVRSTVKIGAIRNPICLLLSTPTLVARNASPNAPPAIADVRLPVVV